MLKKLLKYEYRATYKLYLILYLIVLALAMIVRIFNVVDLSNNSVVQVFSGMFIVTTILCLIGLYFATLIFVLFRFYKNLFTDEGYLMFTLPVSTMKLIISKIIVGMTWVLSSILIIIAAIAIMILDTDVFSSLKELWSYFGKELFDMLFKGEIIQFIIYLINYATSIFGTVCFIYLAVAFGQVILPKHKIAGSVLAYFVISMATGTISTILTVLYYVAMGVSMTSALPSSYYAFTCVLNVAFAILSIFLVNKICKKHLNLS